MSQPHPGSGSASGSGRVRGCEPSHRDCKDQLWLWPPRLFDRQWDEEPGKVTKAIAEMEAGKAKGTECRSSDS